MRQLEVADEIDKVRRKLNDARSSELHSQVVKEEAISVLNEPISIPKEVGINDWLCILNCEAYYTTVHYNNPHFIQFLESATEAFKTSTEEVKNHFEEL